MSEMAAPPLFMCGPKCCSMLTYEYDDALSAARYPCRRPHRHAPDRPPPHGSPHTRPYAQQSCRSMLILRVQSARRRYVFNQQDPHPDFAMPDRLDLSLDGLRPLRALRDVSSSGLVTSGPLASEWTTTSILPKSCATASAVSFTVNAAAAAYRLLVRTCNPGSRHRNAGESQAAPALTCSWDESGNELPTIWPSHVSALPCHICSRLKIAVHCTVGFGKRNGSEAHILRHILRMIVDCVHRVDLGELHERAIGQLPRLIELAAPQVRLEDAERWHLSDSFGFRDAWWNSAHRPRALCSTIPRGWWCTCGKGGLGHTQTPSEMLAPASARFFAMAHPNPYHVSQLAVRRRSAATRSMCSD